MKEMTDEDYAEMFMGVSAEADAILEAENIPIMPPSSTRRIKAKIVRDGGHIFGSQRNCKTD
jgi:hypothetical protein